MRRLIEADEVIKKINENDKRVELDLPVEEMLGEDNIEKFIKLVNTILPRYKKMIVEYIEEQPTANVDKDVRAEAYNKGLEDAWEFVRKTITAVNPQEAYKLLDFFGVANYRDIYKEYTPQEALAKFEAYEKEKAEIKVGDVVETTDLIDVFNGVVLDFKDSLDDEVVVLNENGCVDVWKIEDCKKTGKHIDIQSVLEQIGGAE